MHQKDPSVQRQSLRSQGVNNDILSPHRGMTSLSGRGFSPIWAMPVKPKDSEHTSPEDVLAPRGPTYFEVLGVHPLWFWWLCDKWQLVVGLWRRWSSEWSFSLWEHKREYRRWCNGLNIPAGWLATNSDFPALRLESRQHRSMTYWFCQHPLSLAVLKFWNAHLEYLSRSNTAHGYMAFVGLSINTTGSRETQNGVL